PFGVAIILGAGLRALASGGLASASRVVGVALVGIMLVASVTLSLALVADWHKQMQVSAAIARSEVLRDASTVVFIDSARSLNYDSRFHAFYEFNGWMITAFGDQKRLGVELANLEGVLDGSLNGLDYAASRYGFGEWEPGDENALVEIAVRKGATWWDLVFDRPAIDVTITPLGDLRALGP
ncbi:MAG: hypothetical protein Q8M65_02255, partial [Rhodoglobus sp.]|nr:hypothetical protein [Rhodoglobus sp.]